MKSSLLTPLFILALGFANLTHAQSFTDQDLVDNSFDTQEEVFENNLDNAASHDQEINKEFLQNNNEEILKSCPQENSEVIETPTAYKYSLKRKLKRSGFYSITAC